MDEERPTRRPGYDPDERLAATDPEVPMEHARTRPAPVASAPEEEEEGSEPIFTPGELVSGTYEVRCMLGEGGMAQVWEARDHVLDRRVALKAAQPDPRFPPLRNEARALAAFRHPSLVTVHALGEHRGIEYIVMERIYGVSLADHIEQRTRAGVQFKLEEVLEPLTQIADGLAVVHRAGIAHRDVKPDNVMLTPDHRVVLMDFGLVLPEFDVASQKLVAGSPPYMPPEALSNSTERGSGQLVDVYALGVIAYEMLAGHRPFDDAEDIQDLWQMHVDGRVPDLGAAREGLPEELVELVTEMLAKDPNARPQSAEGVAWAFKRILARAARVPPSSPPVLGGAEEEVVEGIDVLLVEDDEDLKKVMGFYVKQALGNITLRHAADGEQAVKALRERAPDLMLLDLHMPKMNGVEVCMHVRGERLAENTTIVAVSAGAQDHDLQLLHQLGIHHFVQKGADLRVRLATELRTIFGEPNPD